MWLCSAESQKGQQNVQIFKVDNRVLPLYKLSLCDASWRLMRMGFSIIQWFELKKTTRHKLISIFQFYYQFILVNFDKWAVKIATTLSHKAD